MNPRRMPAVALVVVAVGFALIAIVGDRPMFATTLFPALYIATLGRTRRCPPATLRTH